MFANPVLNSFSTAFLFFKNYCDENRVKYWGGKITEYDPQEESKAKLAAAKEQAKLIVEATNLKGENYYK